MQDFDAHFDLGDALLRRNGVWEPPSGTALISFSRTGGRSRYKRVRTLVTRISGEVQVVFAPRLLGSVRRRLQATRRPLTRLMTNITRATTSSR